MTFRDLTGMAVGNLWRQMLRTLLTVVGVSVGVSALVLMVSLGIGIKNAILKQMDSTNLLTEVAVLPMKFDFGAIMQRRKMDKMSAPKKITKETMETMKGIPGVRAVYPNYSFFVRFQIDGTNGSGELYGMPPEGVTESLLDALAVGRIFTDGANEVILSDEMLKSLAPDDTDKTKPLPLEDLQKVIGKKISLTAGAQAQRRPRRLIGPDGKDATFEYEIVGVFAAGKYKSLAPRIYTSMAPLDAARRATLDKEALQENPDALNDIPMLTVRVTDFKFLNPVKEEIEKLGYGTLTIQDLIEMVDNVFMVIESLLGCIGGVGLLVAFFGIANTMLMSILERTREIGIMKAVGGTRFNIATIFLFEASGIGLMGGSLGIFGGWLLGIIGNAGATWYGHSHGMSRDMAPFYVSIWLAGGAMIFSVLVSIVAGLYPAWRAARLDPVVALRHE